MSRREILQGLLATGRLYERPTEYAGYDTGRRMYVTPEILEIATPPFPDTLEGERFGQFGAMLDAFSEWSTFSVAEDPDRKPSDAMLARVHDVRDEFWSIRVTAPEDTPGIRALGAFVDRDEFVALHWEWRESMVDFDAEVAEVKKIWQELFGFVLPYSSPHLRGYLSNYLRV